MCILREYSPTHPHGMVSTTYFSVETAGKKIACAVLLHLTMGEILVESHRLVGHCVSTSKDDQKALCTC